MIRMLRIPQPLIPLPLIPLLLIPLLLVSMMLTLLACDPPKNGESSATPKEASPAGTEKGTPTKGGEALEGTTPQGSWNVVTINGAALLAGTSLSLTLDGDEAHGDGGCNGFGGSVAFDRSTVAFSELAITEMACMEPEGIHAQEDAYMNALNGAKSWKLDGGTLTLLGEGTTLVFTAQQKTVIVDAPFEGTKWNANTFLDGDVAGSLVANTSISLTFEGGKARGGTTCNGMEATYTRDGDTLTISVGAVTERACADPDAMGQESRYLEVLGGVATMKIEGTSLTLLSADGKKGVVYRAE